MDRERVDGAERYLKYLPRCIYIKFEGAGWEVLKTLGPRAFPLYPMECAWKLKIATQSKVTRQGLLYSARLCKHSVYDSGRTLRVAFADSGEQQLTANTCFFSVDLRLREICLLLTVFDV